MEKLKFPFTIEELTKQKQQEFSELWGYCDLVKLENYTSNRRIVKYGEEIYNFKPRPDDIWLIGYPRSEETRKQEILYILGTDFNYAKAASQIMDKRFPFLENILMDDDMELKYEEFLKKNKEPETPEELASLPPHKQLERIKEKRFIKSHLGFAFLHPQLLEVGCKVVFIARNFKDCFISNYFYPSYFDERKEYGIYKMWKLQESGVGGLGDYMELLKEAWKRRHCKNLLIIFYEEITKDKRSTILKLANFLGKEITEEQLQTLLDHTDIKNFKENRSLNNDHLVNSGLYVKNDQSSFIRNGKVGGWRENFTNEMNDEINEWLLKKFQEIPDFQIPQCWKEAMDL